MKARYLFPNDYMADPSAHVFNNRVYIYPSHDWDSGAAFQMKDYHAFSLDDIENGVVTDHGIILDLPHISMGFAATLGQRCSRTRWQILSYFLC